MNIKQEKNVFRISFEDNEFIELKEFPHPLQKGIMPLIAKIDDEFIPLGTGFNITNYGLMITAKHVIDFAFKHIKNTVNTNHYTLDDSLNIFAFYVSDIKHRDNNEHYFGGFIDVSRINTTLYSDVALLQLQVPMINDTRIHLPFFRLSPCIPNIDQTIISFGYSNMKSQRSSSDNRNNIVNYSQNFKGSRGKIKEVFSYKRDNVMLDFPCFRTDSRFDPGMSGGPIIDLNGNVNGLISSSMEVIDEDKSFISYGTMLQHIFYLKALLTLEGDNVPKEYTLHELTNLGHIDVDNSFLNISILNSGGKTILTYK